MKNEMKTVPHSHQVISKHWREDFSNCCHLALANVHCVLFNFANQFPRIFCALALIPHKQVVKLHCKFVVLEYIVSLFP